VTLNDGTTTPVWNKNAPSSGTYHNFTNADRFNYAPFNLLLTPSQRKALFTSLTYDATDSIQLYAKGLFNTRTSTNQAAPEPIFVGPVAQTGGLADRINVSAANPSTLRHRSVRGGLAYLRDRGRQLHRPDARPVEADRAYSTRTSTPGTSAAASGHSAPARRLHLGHQLRQHREQGQPEVHQRLQHRQGRHCTR